MGGDSTAALNVVNRVRWALLRAMLRACTGGELRLAATPPPPPPVKWDCRCTWLVVEPRDTRSRWPSDGFECTDVATDVTVADEPAERDVMSLPTEFDTVTRTGAAWAYAAPGGASCLGEARATYSGYLMDSAWRATGASPRSSAMGRGGYGDPLATLLAASADGCASNRGDWRAYGFRRTRDAACTWCLGDSAGLDEADVSVPPPPPPPP